MVERKVEMATETIQKVIMEDMVVTRIIDAPVKKVWEAWTNPELIKCWWGPKDYTSPLATVDLKAGGKFLFCMRAPREQGGADSYTLGIYSKIVPFKSLEFVQSFADKEGNSITPAQAGLPADVPVEMRSLVTFKRIHNDQLTELAVVEYAWPVGQMYVYSMAGWHQSIDKLSKCLK
jgi:uncharacterized protein YndB with AHSA1/START domain